MLALFAQVQSLNEIHNQFNRVSSHQEVSAVSTTLCDDCHQQRCREAPHACAAAAEAAETAAELAAANTITTSLPATFASVVQNCNSTDSPPPLFYRPPHHNHQLEVATTTVASPLIDDVLIDDDGYCEIDELRMPSIISMHGQVSSASASSSSELSASTAGAAAGVAAVSAGSSGSTTNSSSSNISSSSGSNPSSTNVNELKRQSTISADSIPEETDHEVHAELHATNGAGSGSEPPSSTTSATAAMPHRALLTLHQDDGIANECPRPCEQPTVSYAQAVTSTTTTMHGGAMTSCSALLASTCGVNRLAHVTSIAPAVPCYLLENIVTALNAQMTMLLVSLAATSVTCVCTAVDALVHNMDLGTD